MDLNGVQEKIRALCGNGSKVALFNDSLGHYVLLIIGCLPEDADCEVVLNPPEAKEEDIGQTGACIWVFEIVGNEIFQYNSKHNRPQSERILIGQGLDVFNKLAWVIQNLHLRPLGSSLSTG